MRRSSTTKSTTKILALMIAMVMVLGMVPGMVVAQDSEPPDAKAVQDEKQIAHPGGGDSAELDTVNGKASVEFEKTLYPTGVENEFDIVLTVKTSDAIENLAVPADALVVLLLDVSGSMNSGGKLASSIKAAKEFVASYAESGNGTAVRALAVVAFNTNVNLVQDWINVSAEGNAEAVNSRIDGITAGNWTNVSGALRYANNLLEVAPNDWDDISNKHVILFSDGGPTTTTTVGSKHGESNYQLSSGTMKDDDTGRAGPDTTTESDKALREKYAKHAVAEARLLEKLDSEVVDAPKAVQVHSIGFQTTGKSVCDDYSCDDFLKDVSSTGKLWDAGTEGDLTNAYKNINGIIESIAWEVKDPMADHVEYLYLLEKDGDHYKERVSSDPNVKVEEDEDNDDIMTLTWNVYGDRDNKEKTGDNEYTYVKACRVRLRTEDAGFAEGELYPTNEDTTLQYEFTSSTKPLDKGTITLTHEDEQIPVVEGYAAEGFSFLKVDEKGNAISSDAAEFEFTLEDNCGHDNDFTAANDKDGKVSFENISSGHQYLLYESDGDVNYFIDSENKYLVSVDYGTVTWLNENEEPTSFDGFKFKNTPYISLDKSVNTKSTTVSSTVKYTLTIKNNGFIDLENVVIKDEMFAKAEGAIEIKKGDKVLESADYTISEDGKAITLTEKFAKDEEITVAYYVKFTTTGTFDNTATVTGKEVDGQRTVGAKDTETVTVTTGGGDTTPTTTTTASETTEKTDDTTAPPTTTEPTSTEPTTAAPTTSLPTDPTDPTEVIGETIPEPPTPGAGQTLVPSEDGYELIDEDGTPLGKWTYDPDLEEWVFEEYDVPLGSLPNTGAAMSLVPFFLVGATGGLVALRVRKAKGKDEE